MRAHRRRGGGQEHEGLEEEVHEVGADRIEKGGGRGTARCGTARLTHRLRSVLSGGRRHVVQPDQLAHLRPGLGVAIVSGHVSDKLLADAAEQGVLEVMGKRKDAAQAFLASARIDPRKYDALLRAAALLAQEGDQTLGVLPLLHINSRLAGHFFTSMPGGLCCRARG